MTGAPSGPNRLAADAVTAGVTTRARARAWLDRRHLPIADRIAPVLGGLWTDGFVVGAVSSRTVLAHHGLIVKADTDVATVTMGADWGRWTPGDAEAARELLGAEGMGDGLQALLEHGGIVLKGIEDHKLDQLAGILAGGVQRGDSPAAIAAAIRSLVDDPRWAYRVALTETTRAVSSATLWRYARNGVEAKEWLTAGDQHVCVPCNVNEDQGAVPLDQPFADGNDAPPSHPLCRCSIAPAWLSVEEAAQSGADLTGLSGLGAGEDLAAVVTRPAEDILAEAEPEIAPPPPAEVTGDHTSWVESAPETGLDNPIPVRDLVIYQAAGNYTIAEGWAYKIDDVGYVIERGTGRWSTLSSGADEASARRRVEDLVQFQRSLGDWGRFQKTYTVTAGRNPADAYWEQKHQIPGFRSSAMAGNGHTTLWDPAFGSHDTTLLHEFGHNIDGAMVREGLSSGSPAWRAATTGPDARGPKVYDFKPTGRGLYLSKAPTLIDDPAALFPPGVTPYGQSSITEDYAESVNMHLIDRTQSGTTIGRGRLTPDGPLVDLTFRDLFPARARVLDQVFASQGGAAGAGGAVAPMVAEDLSRMTVPQLRALAKDRGLTGYSKLTKPQLLQRLAGEAEPVTAPKELTVAEQRAAQRAAARERNRQIEARATVEKTLGELDELLGKKAAREVLDERLANVAGLEAKDLAALRNAAGDPAKLRAQITRISKKHDITVDAKVGAKVAYNPDTMEPLGAAPAEGTPMIVVRRGTSVTINGDKITLNRAVVKEAPKPVVDGFPSRGARTVRDLMDSAPTYDDYYNMASFADRNAVISAAKEPIAQAIDGIYGGLEVRVKEIPAFSRDFVSIKGEIRDPATGKAVGKFTRHFERDPAGTVVAHHDLLTLGRAYRGTGFADKFNQNLYDWYRRSGIARVELHANIDVGGYAWAAQGYDFQSTRAAETYLTKARTKVNAALARTPKGLTKQQVHELSQFIDEMETGQRATTAAEIARFGRQPGQGGKSAIWPGKWLMLGTDWYGALAL